MIDFKDYKVVKLIDIAKIERAVNKKIYPAGSIKIQLSATKGLVEFVDVAGEIESRYAVVQADSNINNRYLYISIQRSFPEFINKYLTTMNLQFDTLKNLEVCIHNSETQVYIASMMEAHEKECERNKKIIDEYKNMKKNFLNNMFC